MQTPARPQPSPELLSWHDEHEPSQPSGKPVLVRTLFLRGSECRFHCLMCDLWQYTHAQPTPPGNISAQVRQGVAQPTTGDVQPQWLKLYNAANFFDPHNVPLEDLSGIAEATSGYERIIVENHARVLPWKNIERFQELIKPARLEFAMGLETIHPQTLELLDKRVTVEQFEKAVEQLRARDIDVRVFLLLGLPYLSEAQCYQWCQNSIDWCAARHVRQVSVIPMRSELGAMQQLHAAGRFIRPRAHSLERLLTDNLNRADCVVTVDLWDWNKLDGLCSACSMHRQSRMQTMNLNRTHIAEISCEVCGVARSLH